MDNKRSRFKVVEASEVANLTQFGDRVTPEILEKADGFYCTTTSPELAAEAYSEGIRVSVLYVLSSVGDSTYNIRRLAMTPVISYKARIVEEDLGCS